MEQAKFVFNERRVGTRASTNIELRLKCKDDGAPRYFETRTLPIELSSMGIYTGNSTKRDTYLGTYGVARDITERKTAQETINFQAYHDLLTHLPNRSLLRDRLVLAISQAKRQEEMLAVMLRYMKMGLDVYAEFKGQEKLVSEIGHKLLVLENEILRAQLRKEREQLQRQFNKETSPNE